MFFQIFRHPLKEVIKIALGMDSVVGIELKKKVFGQVGSFVKAETKEEIQWCEVFRTGLQIPFS